MDGSDPSPGVPPDGSQGPRVLGCAAGHRFDVARQGYVALLGPRSRTDTGDSADMVAARLEFLGAGHYRPIAATVAGLAAAAAGPILEIGAGTGYYLGAVLDAAGPGTARSEAGTLISPGTPVSPGPVGIALDSSRFAARRAAADRRVASVLADAWSVLPVRDESVAVVVSVFAPRDLAEVARVLRPGGRFVAVTPEPGHLAEIRGPLGLLEVEQDKADRLAGRAGTVGLIPVGRSEVRIGMSLSNADVAALVRMGPSARHIGPAELADRMAPLPDPVQVTAAVTVGAFQASI